MANYLTIKNSIENILDCTLSIVSKDYRNMILDSIMTTLRDAGLRPEGFPLDSSSLNPNNFWRSVGSDVPIKSGRYLVTRQLQGGSCIAISSYTPENGFTCGDVIAWGPLPDHPYSFT